jgi:hypothetical protein
LWVNVALIIFSFVLSLYFDLIYNTLRNYFRSLSEVCHYSCYPLLPPAIPYQTVAEDLLDPPLDQHPISELSMYSPMIQLLWPYSSQVSWQAASPSASIKGSKVRSKPNGVCSTAGGCRASEIEWFGGTCQKIEVG